MLLVLFSESQELNTFLLIWLPSTGSRSTLASNTNLPLSATTACLAILLRIFLIFCPSIPLPANFALPLTPLYYAAQLFAPHPLVISPSFTLHPLYGTHSPNTFARQTLSPRLNLKPKHICLNFPSSPAPITSHSFHCCPLSWCCYVRVCFSAPLEFYLLYVWFLC